MASIIKVDQIQESTIGVGTNFSGTGSASTPTISIGNQTNKGFYHEGTDKIGVSVGGSKVGEIGNGYGGFTGNIIQVINNTNTYDHTLNYNTSNQDIQSSLNTSWEVSITPKYNNSKIIIYHSIHGISYGPNTTSYSGLGIYIARKIGSGSYSNIINPPADSQGPYQYFWYNTNGGAQTIQLIFPFFNFYIDSPSTTNQCTYKFPIRTYSTGTFIRFNVSGPAGGAGISTVMLQEVQV